MVVLVDYYDEKVTDKVVQYINSSRLFRYFFREINIKGLDKLKNYISDNPENVLYYTSTHRSLFDFIMFRTITHENGFKGNRAARIIAGNNLYVWPLSILWKKTGGLWFNRKNNDYSYLRGVNEDLTGFLMNGIDEAVYLEGQRVVSKEFEIQTAFLTPPIRAFQSGKKNIDIIPVLNSYDDPIEDKKGLDVSHKLKFLDKMGIGKLRHMTDVYMFTKRFVLDGPIGSANLHFGEPIHLKDIVNGSPKKAKEDLVAILKERIEGLRLSN